MNIWRWWPTGRQGLGRTHDDPVSREKERALKLFGEPPPEEPHPYAPDPVLRPSSSSARTSPQGSLPAYLRMPIMVIGILAGAMFGLLMFVDDPKLLLVVPRKWLAEVSGAAGYIDCAHVRLAGAAPLKKGDKGYTKRLDVDGDGIACESILSDDEGADDTATAKKKRKSKAG